jgi:hypothetical protein
MFDGYLTEIHFIDGQALTPSSFGETDTITGVWKPKKYAGTYGTNGFYLNFADNSNTTATTLGKDSSGNGNNWTPNNFSVTAGAGNDSLVDSPTLYGSDTGAGGEVRGNYATLSPIIRSAQGTATLTNGNLDLSGTGSAFTGALSSIAMASGKWYWEYTVNNVGSSNGVGIIATTSLAGAVGGTYGYAAVSDAWLRSLSYVLSNGTTSVTGLGTVTTGDVVMVAVDFDSGKLWFGRNGTWDSSGNPSAGTNPLVTFTVGGKSFYACAQGYWPSGSWSGTINFGQRPFAYTAPSGFKALCTTNLPEPSIKKPGSYMDVVTYTGTGSALTPTSSLGFSPDLVWIKGRSGATDHALYDAVRGAEKRLESNNADAEVTSDGGVTAFNSAGFTLGTLAQVNTSSATYVAWCWDESATPGFDIVTFTAASSGNTTVSHSLGVAPNFILVKSRAVSGYNWAIYHSSIGNTGALIFSTNAVDTNSAWWNNTTPTSTQFVLGSNYAGGGSSVAYLWSEVAGFSKFGSYTGNGSSDGPFCFCGFRPRFVMFKRTDSTGSWFMEDSARGTYNVMGPELYANLSDAETTVSRLDFLSNGFKMRAANAGDNASGGTYVFAAFSESPFKYSLAR